MAAPNLQEVHDVLCSLAHEAGNMIRNANPSAATSGSKKNCTWTGILPASLFDIFHVLLHIFAFHPVTGGILLLAVKEALEDEESGARGAHWRVFFSSFLLFSFSFLLSASDLTGATAVDLVTETDRAVENMVSTKLRARYPTYA
jgi:hypothetical protein